MGFILYTQNGSFNPASYGLTVGDVLFVKVVGGGGGGAGGEPATTGGAISQANGGASSFGSILTAAGGLAGMHDPDKDAFKAFYRAYSNAPGICNSSAEEYGNKNWYYGGAGADGWLPGAKCSDGICPLLYVPIVPISDGFNALTNLTPKVAGRLCNMSNSGSFTAQYSPNDNPFGGAGGISYSYGYAYITIGGLGYGAGGGSAVYNNSDAATGSGGGSGQIRDIVYTLPNLNAIPITVGAGGTGYYRSSYSTRSGGGGARGCVAIWW